MTSIGQQAAIESLQAIRSVLEEEIAGIDDAIASLSGGPAASPKAIRTHDVASDSQPGVTYYVTEFENGYGRCTCAHYVKGNQTCKHLLRHWLTRVDGVTTPPKTERGKAIHEFLSNGTTPIGWSVWEDMRGRLHASQTR